MAVRPWKDVENSITVKICATLSKMTQNHATRIEIISFALYGLQGSSAGSFLCKFKRMNSYSLHAATQPGSLSQLGKDWKKKWEEQQISSSVQILGLGPFSTLAQWNLLVPVSQPQSAVASSCPQKRLMPHLPPFSRVTVLCRGDPSLSR